MNVRTKLIVIIAFVALVPFSVSALSNMRSYEEALTEKVDELHNAAARSGAAIATTYLDGAVRGVETIASRQIPWTILSEEERQGALWLVYGQHPDVVVVSLLDGDGKGVGPAVYLGGGAPVDADAHPRPSMTTLKEFAQRIPMAEAVKNGVGVGAPFAASAGDQAIVPLAFRVDNPSGKNRIVAVGLSLRGVCNELNRTAPTEVTLRLVDREARLLCPTANTPLLTPVQINDWTPGATDKVETVRYQPKSGEQMLASLASTPGGWTLIAEQPLASSMRRAAAIRNRSLFWLVLSALAAAGAGLYLAGGVTRPLRRLREATAKVAEGRFDHRVEVLGQDEFAQAARAFNDMSTEIEKRNAELEEWNVELKDRVQERTDSLKAARDQLIESRKMAAMATLGAGVAHEINNPLTGLLGMAQLLLGSARKREPDGKDVDRLLVVEQEARRIAIIVARMQKLGELGAPEFTELDIVGLLDETLDSYDGELQDAGIGVVREYKDGLPAVFGNRGQLGQAIRHVIDNGLLAMASGDGTLRVTVDAPEDQLVAITIEDTGRGIAEEDLPKIFEPFFATKDAWPGEGLGLTIAHRIVHAHHGRISAESESGDGATFTITLPTMRKGAHLR